MPTLPAVFPNRYAFLIGVQTYTDVGIRSLKTPAQDIRLMADALTAYGYQTYLCENPDKATFVSFLEGIALKTAQKPAQIILYYAGHGVALNQKPPGNPSATATQQAQPDTYGGFLLPADARRGQLAETAISMQWLANLIQQQSAIQVLLILDCCYAGVIRQAASGFRGGIDTDTEEVYQEDFDHYTRYRANQILTSSAHNQEALDQYVTAGETDNQPANSPFAVLLSHALDHREADVNHDGVVTVYELQAYIQQRLEAAAAEQQHDQTSCIFDFSGHEGGEFVFLDPSFSPASLRSRERVNPYKGLASYQPQDKAFFFGRDAAIRDINQLLAATNFLVVVGASGTGKSSLVKAGILGAHPDTDYATIRPGKSPLAELEPIRQNPPRLLLIDQMEELVTQATNRSDEALVRFFAELSAFLQSEAGKQTKVVATMRIEFVAQFNRQERFWNTARQQFTIPVLDVEALQEIIIRPALQTGMFYYPEKDTVARIIEDFRHYPNALPLLSLALNDLYETCKDRPERTIYEHDYPGIGQILEQKEQTILGPFQANIDFFRDLMLRMVAFQGGEYVRRRVSNDELNFGPNQQSLCQTMLDVLTENRLVSGRDPGAGDGYYELMHEALIQAWSTYREWIQQVGNTQLAQREDVAEATLRYNKQGKRRASVWGSLPLLNLIRTGKIAAATLAGTTPAGSTTTDANPSRSWQTWAWNFRSFRHKFGSLTWLSVPERAFLKRSFLVQRQNKLALVGAGLAIVLAIGVVVFLQTRDEYARLLVGAQFAESQNVYKTAQSQYEAADTLAGHSLLLQTGKQFLTFDPDSLSMKARLANQCDMLYQTLNSQLEQADALTNRTVLLLAGRNSQATNADGVGQACRQFHLFIQTDSLYHTLDTELTHSNTRILGSRTTDRLRKRAQAGYQVTGVLLENLTAICREVQEGFQLNGQPDLVAQYGRYIQALEKYRKTK